MGELIEFPSNGGTAAGYLAVPAAGGGPGLIVIQEWWGLIPQIERVCDRFAASGFTALAPDLYHGRQVPLTEPDEAAKAMMAMKMEEAARDLSGAVDELRGRTGRTTVGTVGFCMGGGLALVLACQRPEAVTAVVPFYGVIPWPEAQPDYAAMTGPMLGHFAERDDFFTPEAAAALEVKLRSLGKDATVHVYAGCDHAFFNDDRPEVYNAAASDLAFDRSVAFLHEHLG